MKYAIKYSMEGTRRLGIDRYASRSEALYSAAKFPESSQASVVSVRPRQKPERRVLTWTRTTHWWMEGDKKLTREILDELSEWLDCSSNERLRIILEDYQG